jgi:predicted DNA-binding transcriptional regulator AlpA
MPKFITSHAGRKKTAPSTQRAARGSPRANDTSAKQVNTRVESSLLKFDTLPAAAHVKVPVVAALYGIGPASVWRWSKSGHLPKPVKLGPQATAWNVGELRAHLAARRAEG